MDSVQNKVLTKIHTKIDDEDQDEIVYLTWFTNEIVVLDEFSSPTRICCFCPDMDPDTIRWDKKRNRRSGTKVFIDRKPDADVLKDIDNQFTSKNMKKKKKKKGKFVSSAGTADVLDIKRKITRLEKYLTGECGNSSDSDSSGNNSDMLSGIDTCRDYTTALFELIRLIDCFDKFLSKRPMTPQNVRDVANARIKLRQQLWSEFITKKMWTIKSPERAHNLFSEFDALLTERLILARLNPSLVSDYINIVM